MARTYGAIQTMTPYVSGTINLADYGTVINDNGYSVTTCSNNTAKGFIRVLWGIKNALASAGISATQTTLVNSSHESSNYFAACLSFIMENNEYLLAAAVTSNTGALGLHIKKNSSTISMRLSAPSSINSYYNVANANGSDIYYDLDKIGSNVPVRNYIFYYATDSTDGTYTEYFQAVYDDRGFVVLLAKSDYNTVSRTCITFGNIGTSNEFDSIAAINQPWIAINGHTPQVLYKVPGVSESVNGTLASALGSGIKTPNTATGVVAFPVYMIPPLGDTSGYMPEVPLGSLAIYADAMLATSNEPSVDFGTRFANGTWLCVFSFIDTPSSINIQSAILIAWGGNSVPSVFD